MNMEKDSLSGLTYQEVTDPTECLPLEVFWTNPTSEPVVDLELTGGTEMPSRSATSELPFLTYVQCLMY